MHPTTFASVKVTVITVLISIIFVEIFSEIVEKPIKEETSELVENEQFNLKDIKPSEMLVEGFATDFREDDSKEPRRRVRSMEEETKNGIEPRYRRVPGSPSNESTPDMTTDSTNKRILSPSNPNSKSTTPTVSTPNPRSRSTTGKSTPPDKFTSPKDPTTRSTISKPPPSKSTEPQFSPGGPPGDGSSSGNDGVIPNGQPTTEHYDYYYYLGETGMGDYQPDYYRAISDAERLSAWCAGVVLPLLQLLLAL